MSKEILNPLVAAQERVKKACDKLGMEDKVFEKYSDGKIIGESDLLDSEILVELKKENICNETPYAFEISFVKQTNDNQLVYKLPTVRFGISKDKSYIYAIQKAKTNEDEQSTEELAYQKKINRLMYKVNQGLDLDNQSFDNENNSIHLDYYRDDIHKMRVSLG